MEPFQGFLLIEKIIFSLTKSVKNLPSPSIFHSLSAEHPAANRTTGAKILQR